MVNDLTDHLFWFQITRPGMLSPRQSQLIFHLIICYYDEYSHYISFVLMYLLYPSSDTSADGKNGCIRYNYIELKD